MCVYINSENYRRQTRNGPIEKRNDGGHTKPSWLMYRERVHTFNTVGFDPPPLHPYQTTPYPYASTPIWRIRINVHAKVDPNKGTLLVSGCAGFAGVCEQASVSIYCALIVFSLKTYKRIGNERGWTVEIRRGVDGEIGIFVVFFTTPSNPLPPRTFLPQTRFFFCTKYTFARFQFAVNPSATDVIYTRAMLKTATG